MDFVHLGREAFVGFIGEGGSNDLFYAGAPGRISEEARINAVTGDDAQCFWNFHEARIINGARRGELGVNLTPPATLDVQLGQRFLQRCLHGRYLFGAEIFFHRRLGPRDGGFRRGLVNDRGFERHVGEDRNR